VFNGRIQVTHPDIDPSTEAQLSTMGLRPFYITTERLKNSFIHSHDLEQMMRNDLGLLVKPLA
jgi:ATP-dependent DNA helicase RecG